MVGVGGRRAPLRRVQLVCEALAWPCRAAGGLRGAGQCCMGMQPCCLLLPPSAAGPHQSMIRLALPSLPSVLRPRIPRRSARKLRMVRPPNPALGGMRAPRTLRRPGPRPMPRRRRAWWWQRCCSGGGCRRPTSSGRRGPIAAENRSRWSSGKRDRRPWTALAPACARPGPPPPGQRTLPCGPRSEGRPTRPPAPQGRRAGPRAGSTAGRPRPPAAAQPHAQSSPLPPSNGPAGGRPVH